MSWESREHQNPAWSVQFPQPTRPINSYFLEEEEKEKGEEERQALQKLLRSIIEIYEKLPEKIRNQLNQEGVMGQIYKEKGTSEENFTYSSRGVESSKLKELSQKLERFKIRTLDPGGVVVKDDESDKK